MKIVHILPGSGDTFYCENCLRDNQLVRGLRKLGHDVVLVPMYLPPGMDAATVDREAPIFFGGINVYLQQRLGIFRRTPRWFDRLLDARWLLRGLSRRAGSTRASGLGDMTLSMLKGRDGNQRKELKRLTCWLTKEGAPDVVHLSNILLLGLAPALKQALGAPVVYTMMDEDSWVDGLGQPFAGRCWESMAMLAEQVDAFVAVSGYYGDLMQQRLRIPADRMHRVPVGIDVDGYTPSTHQGPPTIGYLSRLSHELGLGTLVDAFIELKRDTDGLADLKLQAMGGSTGDDAAFISEQRAKLSDAGMADDALFMEELDRASRIAFLQDVSLVCVPTVAPVAFGTFSVEAMASGVPVVEPRLGGLPELIEKTGGGVLYDPSSPGALRAALRSVLLDPVKLRELGERGRTGVLEAYTLQHMVANTLEVYRHVAV